MKRDLFADLERYPLAQAFTISRGSKTEAAVVTCTIAEGDVRGIGECVPYARYGESLDGVRAAILGWSARIGDGAGRDALLREMEPGAARNALDCALWDLEAKLSGVPAHVSAGIERPAALETAYTISLGEPEAMAETAARQATRPLLKVKVGTDDDIARIEAVAGAAPASRIILDANEGWSEDNIRDHLLVAARHRIALIEQPLPAGKDAILARIPHPVPICADESVHTEAGLEELVSLYDAINIKLDKTGGLTGALRLRDRGRELGFGIMVGCMVGSSLAMAPALLVAQGAEFVDLDGPLLLDRDREPSLRYDGSMVYPALPGLWG